MKRGNCAALLAPVPNAGIKLLAPPSYLVDGNLSVKLKRGSGEVFIWKKDGSGSDAGELKELESFRRELTEILDLPPKQ